MHYCAAWQLSLALLVIDATTLAGCNAVDLLPGDGSLPRPASEHSARPDATTRGSAPVDSAVEDSSLADPAPDQSADAAPGKPRDDAARPRRDGSARDVENTAKDSSAARPDADRPDAGRPVSGKAYSVNFSTSPDDFRGGKWLQGKADGRQWSDIRVVDGKAVGTDNYEKYSDPTALLTGSWSADQTVEATVYRKYPGVVNNSQEVELRLRSTMRAGWCSGYEILFRAYDKPIIAGNYGRMPHFAVVKWKGPRGVTIADFTPFLAQGSDAKFAITDGDKIKASIKGNVIDVYKNGEKLISVTDKDNTFTVGNPGIGFNYNCNGHYEEFGFYDFKATSD